MISTRIRSETRSVFSPPPHAEPADPPVGSLDGVRCVLF
eukprot:COSAG01_NODE_53345_length_339_cov_143.129167_1_plen_38_part_10